MNFVLINEGTSVSPLTAQLTPAVLTRIAAAITVQLNRDFAPEWGGAYVVRAGSSKTDIVPGEIVFALVDTTDVPDAVAYHDVQGAAVPFALLALTTCSTIDDVTTGISHECCETGADVDCDVWVDDGAGNEWAQETCDAVESASYQNRSERRRSAHRRVGLRPAIVLRAGCPGALLVCRHGDGALHDGAGRLPNQARQRHGRDAGVRHPRQPPRLSRQPRAARQRLAPGTPRRPSTPPCIARHHGLSVSPVLQALVMGALTLALIVHILLTRKIMSNVSSGISSVSSAIDGLSTDVSSLSNDISALKTQIQNSGSVLTAADQAAFDALVAKATAAKAAADAVVAGFAPPATPAAPAAPASTSTLTPPFRSPRASGV